MKAFVMGANPYRQLPSVTEVLDSPAVKALFPQHSHDEIVSAIRLELDGLRDHLKQGEGGASDDLGDCNVVAQRVTIRLENDLRPRLRTVINATGIVLHTNLGRAPLAEEAALAAYAAGRGYLNLELDLETGKRSSRQDPLRDGLCRLTGAESATAVNNCAAATVIVLRALCAGREVIVSRGQLIEIGGSFRIPEIMGVSGAILREVGTTNITRIGDYERAINPNTAALMRVHTSNYRVSGFTKAASLEDLIDLGMKHRLPVIDDVGSGALVDFKRFGFEGEPIARESIAAGADLVLMSGDKLMGGPQAGIIVGRKEWIAKIEQDPLMRAFRLDKMTLAALEATLRIYKTENRVVCEIPTLRMLATSLDELRFRAGALAERLLKVAGIATLAEEDVAYVGGGSLPDQAMKTIVLAVRARGLSDADLAHRLRTGDPSVLGRVQDGKVLLDLRTIFPEQEDALVDALRSAVTE